MSRLIDASICPDCRAVLDEESTCTSCDLALAGPLASQLWSLMVDADRLVERLRVTGPADSPATIVALSAPGPMPRVRRTAQGRSLPAASVPVVLLALGALCLVVAGAVFAAVAWGHLGLGARTAILLGITALLASAARSVTGRNLRGSAEALWLVTAGMLTIDLLAAHGTGLLGLDTLSWRATGALIGLALLSLGVGVALWARTQPVARLIGSQGVAVLGALAITVGYGWDGPHPTGLGTSIAIPLLVAVALPLRRTLPVTSYGVGTVAVASWLFLVGTGLDLAMRDAATPALWWTHLQGWPLLVAAAYAGGVAMVTVLPQPARTVAAGGSLTALSVLAAGPGAGPTANLLVAGAIVLGLAVVCGFGPTVWAHAAGVLTAVVLLGYGLRMLSRPAELAQEATARLSGGHRSGLGPELPGPDGGAAAWTALLVAAVVVAGGWCLLRRAAGTRFEEPARTVARASALGVLALGAGTFALAVGVALWVPVVALLAAGLVSAVVGLLGRDDDLTLLVAIAWAAYPFGLALAVARPSYLLSAAAASLLVAVLVAGHVLLRPTSLWSAALAGSAVVAALCTVYAVLAWGHVAGWAPDARAVVLAVVIGSVGVAAGRVARDGASRFGLEVTTLVVGLLVAAASPDPAVAAMVLTIIGTATCLVAVLNRDRTLVSWAGASILGVATLLRLDLHVRLPEAYTLPAAALLLAAGGWRLLSDEDVDSVTALGSGLTLALLPSLLITLDEPISLRGALLAAAGLVVLATGVARHWSAPFVAGAAVTALLALRYLAPIADAIPRWVALGTAGVALLAVGVTWEQRRREVRGASRYLAALR